MACTQDLQNRITELESLIDSGATSITQDGQTVAFDVTSARKRLRELKNELEKANDGPKRRPRIFTIDLRG
jgi:hypothetical protein